MLTPLKLSEVKQEPVRWIWPHRIPEGALTILEGDPGLSKSTVSYDLAARITTARPCPGYRFTGKKPLPGNIILLQAEDDAATTIGPNLEAMGADLSRIRVIDRRILSTHPTTFPEAVADIERLLDDEPARLIVVDPLASFLTGNISNDKHVRSALAPLVEMAARRRTAIVGIRHLSKQRGRQSLYRGMGSIGLTGLARSVLRIVLHPESQEERLLVHIKSNLSPLQKSLVYRVERAGSGATIKWLGVSEIRDDDTSPRQGGGVALDEAKKYLCALLSEGQLEVGQIKSNANVSGITYRTLQRAKEDLGIASVRIGFGPGAKYCWRLNETNAYVREFLESEAQAAEPAS